MRRLIVSFATSVCALGGLTTQASAEPCPADAAAAPSQDVVEVYAEDGWYSAQILQTSGNNYLVHYLDTTSESDEWVDASRVRAAGQAPAEAPVAAPAVDPQPEYAPEPTYAPEPAYAPETAYAPEVAYEAAPVYDPVYAPTVYYEPAVQVYWGSDWVTGTLLGINNGRYHVRYRGVDEWMPAARLHLRAAHRTHWNAAWTAGYSGGFRGGYHGGYHYRSASPRFQTRFHGGGHGWNGGGWNGGNRGGWNGGGWNGGGWNGGGRGGHGGWNGGGWNGGGRGGHGGWNGGGHGRR